MTRNCIRHARVLFAHDGPLEVGPDGVPRGVHLTDALIDRYMQLGSELTFLTRARPVSSGEASKYSPLEREGFRFAPVDDVKGPLKRLFRGGAARLQIQKEVAAHDVFVVRLPSTVGRWTYKEARRLGKPVLIEFVACTWDALWNYSLLGKVSAPYFFIKNRSLLRRAEHVVYVTEAFLQRRYPTQGKCIACSDVVVEAADTTVLNRRLERIAARRQADPIILATIAPVDVLYKDQATVFRALAELGQRNQRFLYRLIGPGCQKRLKALANKLRIESQVEFLGPVPHARVPEWLDQTDWYIQASRTEGLPRALIEAMSRGCLALGSNAGGIPELLPPSRIFRAGDYRALAQMLAQLRPADMVSDSRRNFDKAAQFDARALEQRRRAFFKEFLSDAKSLQEVTAYCVDG